MRRTLYLTCLAGSLTVVPACSTFDTTRATPPRGSVGREIYSVLCDRVAAQGLRDDVTGSSFHAVCHPDELGSFASTVDRSQLPSLEGARRVDGTPVPASELVARREHAIARVEALARRREDFIVAMDAVLPDVRIPVRDLGNPVPAQTCAVPADPAAREAPFHDELRKTLSRLFGLYDDETIPTVTRAMGELFGAVVQDPSVQSALARLDARRGYRPPSVALGVVRPFLSYPRLEDLANAVLRLLAEPPKTAAPQGTPTVGAARGSFQALLRAVHEELRTPSEAKTPEPLARSMDPVLKRSISSRAKTPVELAKELLLEERDAYGDGRSGFIVARDPRSLALVPRVGGLLPAPFVDADGDGLPDIDALGRFVTTDGAPAPTPFLLTASDPAPRDEGGRAVRPGGREPLYAFLDARRTLLGGLLRTVRPLVAPKGGADVVDGILAALPVVAGPRDAAPTSTKTYARSASDPKGTTAAQLSYRAFRAEQSPLVDLVHAAGLVVGTPEMDDALALLEVFLNEHPEAVARFAGLLLRLKAIADAHPEASLPASSTLWDEILALAVPMAQTPGIFEDLVRALGQDTTVKLGPVLATWLRNKDRLSYQRDATDKQNLDKLNGVPWNQTTGERVDLARPMATPVDRSRPDTGENRSAFQRLLQLLHDTNGLAACTKAGAVAPIRIRWPPDSPISIPVSLDYPTNPLTKAVCAFVGSVPADPLPVCGILRIKNVAELLLDVTLNRAKFDITDTCLRNIVNNPVLTSFVGGADRFLEDTSGIKGFSLHPTVNGVARLVWLQTPYAPFPASPGFGGDDFYDKPRKFVSSVIDPVPSMVCPETPITYVEGGVTKTLPLRKCTRFEDTLRGRDEGGLFPLETMDFMQLARPIAAAFADHDKPLLFVEAADTLHRHWGSERQSREECDPTAPRTDARWCSQDGVVRYEPLLADMLDADLLPTVQSLVSTLAKTKVPHCVRWSDDGRTCQEATDVDGVEVMANLTRLFVDPARWPGLKDRQGRTEVTWNDGQRKGPATPLGLLLDALAGVDRAFAKDKLEAKSEPSRVERYRAARSALVDTFFGVQGQGDLSHWTSPLTAAALPTLVRVLHEQTRAHCPDRRPEARCSWLTDDGARKLEEALSGPVAAASLDLLDTIRADADARGELEAFARYLLDPEAPNDAAATTMAAAADIVQILSDDANLEPLLRLVSEAAAPPHTDAEGRPRRGLADAMVDLLGRVFARAVGPDGARHCAAELDPNGTFAVVSRNLVTPMASGETPLEVLAGVVADVNRAAPAETSKLTGTDYASIADNAASFCLDEASGLEQLYAVLRQATGHP